MNLSLLWSISALTADLAEVITYLTDDPNYSKTEAAEQLKEILMRHIDPLYQKALNGD